MRNRYVASLFFVCSLFAFSANKALAQSPYSFKVHSGIKVGLKNDFDPNSVINTPTGVYHIPRAYPKPASNAKANKAGVNSIRQSEGVIYGKRQLDRRTTFDPVIAEGFSGALNVGIPNDNNLAISKSGWVVSVLNTHIRVYDDTGRWYKNWSLEFFPRAPEQTGPNGVGLLNRSYDPKITYDPIAERFVIVYLEGSESSDTRIIVAFSKSDNPLDGWFVYELDGNPFLGKTWSDYPIIAISKEDLYITVNILKDSTDWRDGFTQSVIWQVPKSFGYAGDSLRANLISDIKYNDKALWSICAIPGGFELFDQGMFFLSVRPGDAQNDTVFLHRINTNFSQGEPQYSLTVLKTDKPYGLPPDASQPQVGYRLQSNDTRVLSGFYHANKIQYVQTSRNFQNNRSSVFHATIIGVFSDPQVTAKNISHDSLDFAYPSMVYAGDGGWNDNAIITFSHSSENHFPGSSVVYMDNGGNYSNIIRMKEGLGLINTFLPDSIERWGDYTGIQRDYRQPGAFWTAGSYGQANNTVGTWINKVIVNDMNVNTTQIKPIQREINAFPNPAKDLFQLSFYIENAGNFTIQLIDVQGKVVFIENKEASEIGQYLFNMNIGHLSSGVYFYRIIQSTESEVVSGKFLVE